MNGVTTRRPRPGQGSMPGLVPLESIRTEKAFQATIWTTAERNGWMVNHVRRAQVQQGPKKRWVTNTSLKGWPDLVLIHPEGYIMFIEVKGVDGAPSDEQVALMVVLQKLAGIFDATAKLSRRYRGRFRAFVAYPEDWPKLEPMLTLPARRAAAA